jgi:hypothetical protein
LTTGPNSDDIACPPGPRAENVSPPSSEMVENTRIGLDSTGMLIVARKATGVSSTVV